MGGIHGMQRPREWDAIATVETAGLPGEEAWLVALPGGRVLVEEGAAPDASVLTTALRLEPPFRARAVRRESVWVVAGRRIETMELRADPGGDELELAWDGSERSLRVDGEPTLASVPELERLGEARHAVYIVTARRLAGRTWEVEVSPL